MKILRLLDENFEKILSVLLLMTMVALLTTIVFFRFVLGRGLSFAEEIDRWAFVWMVYIGAAYTAQMGAHIRLEAVQRLFPVKLKKFIEYFADFLWVCFCVVVVFEGVKVVISMFEMRYESPALGINMAYVYFIIPLSFILMGFRVIQRNFRRIREERASINVESPE